MFVRADHMKWEIDYIKDHRIVKAKTSGQIGWEGEIKLIEEMLVVGCRKKTNAFLVDQKEAALGLSVLEVDRLPETFRNIGFGANDKMAILYNHESPYNKLYTFLQNVFTVNLLQIRIFTDSEKATSWLKKKT